MRKCTSAIQQVGLAELRVAEPERGRVELAAVRGDAGQADRLEQADGVCRILSVAERPPAKHRLRGPDEVELNVVAAKRRRFACADGGIRRF